MNKLNFVSKNNEFYLLTTYIIEIVTVTYPEEIYQIVISYSSLKIHMLTILSIFCVMASFISLMLVNEYLTKNNLRYILIMYRCKLLKKKNFIMSFHQFQCVLEFFYSITIPAFILFMQTALSIYTFCLNDLSALFKIAFLFSIIAVWHTLTYFWSGFFVNRIYTKDEYNIFFGRLYNEVVHLSK